MSRVGGTCQPSLARGRPSIIGLSDGQKLAYGLRCLNASKARMSWITSGILWTALTLKRTSMPLGALSPAKIQIEAQSSLCHALRQTHAQFCCNNFYIMHVGLAETVMSLGRNCLTEFVQVSGNVVGRSPCFYRISKPIDF